MKKKNILATKGHQISDDPDTNWFTDVDLLILGTAWDTYDLYCRQIRKEYGVYPDAVYKEGRTKVLKSFLQKPHIFKAPEFQNQYERQGRFELGERISCFENPLKF